MAYTTATFKRLYVNGAGIPVIVLTYTGNAGETPLDYEYAQDLSTTPTADYIRAFAIARIANLNRVVNFVAGATPFLGTTLDVTTALPVTASTLGSFVAASAPFTPGTTPQDVATIYGSATRQVTVTRIAITTVQTTAGINAWSVIKRSSANTGGTSATISAVPLNSQFPAATATTLQYTANATGQGATVGNVWTGRILAPATASVVSDGQTAMLTGLSNPSVVLNGTSQGLGVNLGGIALPAGLSVQVAFWWNEQ